MYCGCAVFRNWQLGGRILGVPNFAPTQPRDCIQNCILRRMNVARRDCYRCMPSDSRQRPRRSRIVPAASERVAQRAEHKGARRPLIALRGLFRHSLERFRTVLPQARRFYVAAARSGGPYPTFLRFPGRLPSRFENDADAWRHWNYAARRCRFASRHQ
jgi:hypothetical protein